MSVRTAPTKRIIAAGLGKIPTTRDRRLISLLIRSSGFVDEALPRRSQPLMPVSSRADVDGGRCEAVVRHAGQHLLRRGGASVAMPQDGT